VFIKSDFLYDLYDVKMSNTCVKCGKVCKSLGGLRTHQRACQSHVQSPAVRVRPVNLDDDFNPIKPDMQPTQEPSRKPAKEPAIQQETHTQDTNAQETALSDLKEHSAVSNKEALRDKIHEIHNYLRNHGAGYGMNALKLFNIVYGLKKIEEAGLIDKAELKRPECEFSYILQFAKIQDNEKVDELLYRHSLDAIAAGPLRNMLFYEIPSSIKPEVLGRLVREIEKIAIIEKTCNVLLSGKVYEYFIGRDETAISELGAYFTDRHIVEFIMKRVNPTLDADGKVQSMIDMFGGSGGFTTGYINYLNENNESIDWVTEVNKIYHSDINQDVLKSAALEIFCLTGQIPNLLNNITYRNAFVNEFVGPDNKPRKYHYVLTNPPYGGDKNIKSSASIKRGKIRNYIMRTLPLIKDEQKKADRILQLQEIDKTDNIEKYDAEKARVTLKNCSNRINKFAKGHNVTGNDKESCSLMLLMETVELGGTGVGVLKEGVFFNRLYADLRRCLIRNYNVREVISVEADQFENTSTKTSILIFDNTGSHTRNVRFSKLTVSKFTEDKFVLCNGKVCLVENTGDISDVYDELVAVASIDEILKHPLCSLNGRDYNRPVLHIGADYELVKLADVCQFLPKSTRPASYGQPIGKYNFYTSSAIVQRCDTADYKTEALIIGSGGVANIKMDKNFSCSADNMLLCGNNIVYLFHLIKSNMQLLADGFTGSTIKHLSKTYLQNIQFPMPKEPAKLAAWTAKISAPYIAWQTAKETIAELEIRVMEQIAQITSEDFETVDLGSLCEYIKTGKNKTPDNKQGTKYPYYGTSEITGYTDYYLFDGPHILIARNGTMGNCFLVNGKIYPSDHIFVIRNNKNIALITLYYMIRNVTSQIQSKSNGSVIKGISKESLSTVQIKLPKNKQLVVDLNPLFAEIEQHTNAASMAHLEYIKLLNELSAEAMPKTDTELLDENLDL
jgi:type I restriction-modification system DNA methylase subunit/restriction endonuclease S subunit